MLQGVIVTSYILKSLWEGGEGREEGWFIKTQYLIVVQLKEEKSIFYVLRIYFYFMIKVHTSEIVLTYNQKINFGIIYNYQHHNYQKL